MQKIEVYTICIYPLMQHFVIGAGSEMFSYLKISSQMPARSQNLPLTVPILIICHFGHFVSMRFRVHVQQSCDIE